MARTSVIHDRSNLAKVLGSMTYAELLSVANSLVTMVADGERQIDNDAGMADLLSSWAECELDREEEETEV